MSEEDQQKADMALVQKHVDELGEQFDSVQVFCTRHEAGEHDGTINLNLGAGNWFTRYGHVLWWIKRETPTGRKQQDESTD